MHIRSFRHLLPDGPSTGSGGQGGDGAASSGASGGQNGGSQGGAAGGQGSEGGNGAQNGGQGGSQGAGGAAGGQGGGSGGSGEPQDVSGLPQWAQDHIRGLRNENAGHRQAKTAAEQRADGLTEAVKRHLGLSEAPNAEQLGEQLASAQAAARAAQVELAVARTAGEHGADPAKLLDSRSFLSTVGELDPTAADFTTKVGDAIKAGVQANPALKTAEPEGDGGRQNGSRRPAPDRSQGSSARGRDAQASGVSGGRERYRSRHPQRSGAST